MMVAAVMGQKKIKIGNSKLSTGWEMLKNFHIRIHQRNSDAKELRYSRYEREYGWLSEIPNLIV